LKWRDYDVKSRKLWNEKNYFFVPKTQSKIIELSGRGYFFKTSFRNNFRIIFLIEKIGFSKELSKKVGARDKHRQGYGVIPG
jgi:hypothetical protein